jgi:phenylpropionate dioxygenase-like ring-hydroxylating dioxygenase large terminal subunit
MDLRSVEAVSNYLGYRQRVLPDQLREDAELTHVGPGTPCGELMRRFWQPVCLASEIADLPKAIRILGEDLVVFRDRGGRVGLLHRHCSHRGTSLEYGIVADRGIRCCYHGWLFDVDGRILETPGEPPGSKLKDSFVHGAYPAREERGIVFAYLGPPDATPPFPEVERYGTAPEDCVPFSIPEPCNWLQVHENNMDPMHAPFLHGNVSGVQLTAAFGVIPVVDYVETNGGASMHYISVRRTAPDRVWVRFQQVAAPNYTEIGSPMEEGFVVKPFQRPAWNRWTVPIDDVHCTQIGWRYFRPGLDEGLADRSRVGFGTLDAGGFQDVDDRPYEEQQRRPGDWIAQVGQRPIAIHSREHLGATDAGVTLWRRIVRRAIRGETGSVVPPGLGGTPADMWSHAGDAVLPVPKRVAGDEGTFLRHLGREVSNLVMAHGRYRGDAADEPLRVQIAELARTFEG